MTTVDWIKLIAQVGSAGIVLIGVLKFAHDSKRVTDAITAVERTTPRLEGDTTSDDEKTRKGLLGRVSDLEKDNQELRELVEKMEGQIAGSQVSVQTAFDKVWRRVRAILRGMGVSSDISDDVRLEREIKKRVAEPHVKVDALAASIAIVDQTGPHQAVQYPQHPQLQQPQQPQQPSSRIPTPPPMQAYRPGGHITPAHGTREQERVPRPYQRPIPRSDSEPPSDED